MLNSQYSYTRKQSRTCWDENFMAYWLNYVTYSSTCKYHLAVMLMPNLRPKKLCNKDLNGRKQRSGFESRPNDLSGASCAERCDAIRPRESSEQRNSASERLRRLTGRAIIKNNNSWKLRPLHRPAGRLLPADRLPGLNLKQLKPLRGQRLLEGDRRLR